MYVLLYMWIYGWVCVLVAAPGLVRAIRTRWQDPIWICVRYEPDTLAIWRPIHGVIHRSVLVRAVKTRRRFRNRVISCECSFLCIYRCWNALLVAFIILDNFLLYFISLMICTSSWDIYDCPLYSCRWYLLVLASCVGSLALLA